MVKERTAPLYTNSVWTTVPDEYKLAWDQQPDAENTEILRSLGFSSWTRIGDEQALDVPLNFEVFQRSEKLPHFLIVVEGNTHGEILHAYAQTLPDLMSVLSQWVPAVQGAAITEALRQLNALDVDARRPTVDALSRLLGR